jgi:spore coat polysaccharide biosynthesis protein SpsF (cytidylyltransferase family)
MGSSRLPGKVLMKLAGKTVLERVLERCGAIEGITDVCCAIPEGSKDDIVAEGARVWGAKVVRGSEVDVLQRYYDAALFCRADFVMRVTSDCPLLDPFVAARVLNLIQTGEFDYSCNNLPRTWPHGLDCEAFPFAQLERAAREATSHYDREHVTPYLRNHPDLRKGVVHGPAHDVAKQRWTLDTPGDFEFLQALFERMPEGVAGYDYRVPLRILGSDPGIAAKMPQAV